MVESTLETRIRGIKMSSLTNVIDVLENAQKLATTGTLQFLINCQERKYQKYLFVLKVILITSCLT